MYVIKSPIFPPDKYLLCVGKDKYVFGSHTKQIVLSNLHNIHKLPNIFVLTYTQQIFVWRKNWWFYKVHFSTLMVDFSDSSRYICKMNLLVWTLDQTTILRLSFLLAVLSLGHRVCCASAVRSRRSSTLHTLQSGG